MPRGELSVPEAPPAVGWLAETDWWGTGQGVLLAVLLLIPLALSPQDWAGWCLLYASFAVVLGPREIRVRPVLAWSLCLVLAVHHLAALVDTWLFTLPGGGVDAALFASRAEALVDRDLVFRLGSSFYSYLLAALYKPLGASPLIGREISVLAFAVALVYFVRLLQLLELQRFAPQLSLLFGLLPATIIFTSLTLREPLELALLITAVFYSMRALRGPRRLRSAGLVLVMAIGMGLLHMVLLLYAGLLALLFVLWPTGGG
ncbi:MAG: hypothetical protein LJE84_13690, partial [Gammaproteobacteria bacterium]|nr:hypothetical protein [Gammaproteobacteria bacterium]